MIFNPSGGLGLDHFPPVYTVVSGTAPLIYYSHSGINGQVLNWEMVFTGNCTIKFTKVVPKIDVFLVGAGANGAAGSGNHWAAYGGAGGKGGACVTKSGVSVSTGTNYTITVGQPSGGNSTAFGYTASGGAGSAGGTGGHSVGDNYSAPDKVNPTNGTNGSSYAFGSSTSLYNSGWLYGPGGGGGKAINAHIGATGTAKGGNTGGGAGGAYSTAEAMKGLPNTGGGGGGGYSDWPTTTGNSNQPGGTGGSGIVIIRNAR